MKTKVKNKKWYDLGIEYLLYALVIFVPALFHPDFYSAFGAPKLLALRLITVAVILLWGLKIFVEGRLNLRKSGFNWILLIYGAVCVITTVFSSAIYSSILGSHGRFRGLITIINLLLLPVFIWNFLKEKELARRLLIIGVSVSGILAFYGILQYFGVWQEQFNWNQDPADRVFGTIGHGNHFGAYLGMNLVLGIFLVRELKNKWLKYAWYLGLVAHAVAIFLTAGRGAIFAVVLALLVCGVVILVEKRANGEFGIGKWLAPAFVVVAVLIGGAVIFKDEIAKFPLVERTAITLESIGDGKIPDRYSWWLSSAEMIKDRPLVGYGLSTFRDAYNSYRRLDYQTVEEGDQELHITPEAAHNEYLNIAATQGFLGLIAWLMIIFFVMGKLNASLMAGRPENAPAQKDNARVRPAPAPTLKANPYYYSLLGLKGALVVYLVQVFFSFGVISTLTVFFVYMGAALVLAAPEEKATAPAGRTELKAARRSAIKHVGASFVKYIIPLFMIALAVAGTACVLRTAIADYHYKAALTESAQSNQEGAMQNFTSAIALMPYEYAYQQALGDYALTTAQPVSATESRRELLETAVTAYQEALKINDHHPSVYYNLGIAQIHLYSLSGDSAYYNDAVKNLDESAIKALNNPLYPYQAAKAFMPFDDSESRYYAILFLRDALDIRENYRDANQLLEQLTGKNTAPAGANENSEPQAKSTDQTFST